MAEILFAPVCSNCHKVIPCNIDYEEWVEPITISKLEHIKRYNITPYSCPFCEEKFERIEMPKRLPYKNTIFEINKGETK